MGDFIEILLDNWKCYGFIVDSGWEPKYTVIKIHKNLKKADAIIYGTTSSPVTKLDISLIDFIDMLKEDGANEHIKKLVEEYNELKI